MDNSEADKRLKSDPGDVAHAIVKGVLSQVPLVGGAASEFFSLYIASPLSRRRDDWIESLDQRLTALEREVEGFRKDQIGENELFVTAFLHAVPMAVRSHQQEKREALRNAVLHAALREPPDEDLQLIFLRYIDTFTPWHLRVLKYLQDPPRWMEMHDITPDHVLAGSRAGALEHAVPELRGRQEFYDQLVKDLHARGLINTDSLHGMVTAQGMLAPLISATGERFLTFIASPR